MENTVKREADLQSPKAKEDFERATAKGKDDMEKIKAAGIQPGQMLPRAPQAPEGTLRPFDVLDAVGFAVCGEDKAWHWAKGKMIANNKVELTWDKVSAPIAARYAWADNPVANLFSNEGLPVTPFRTDDFERTTKPKSPVAPAPAVKK
jgi:hypothetical protein